MRAAAAPYSIDNLIRHTHQLYLEARFADVDREAIARKCYMVQTRVIASINRYLAEQPSVMSQDQIITETAELVQSYVATLSRHRL